MIDDTDPLEVAWTVLQEPLTRIRRAAEELAASAGSETRLAQEICDAVGELDHRIEAAGGSRGEVPSDRADLWECLARVVAGLVPVFEARGIELAMGARPSAQLSVDPSLVRRSVCRILLGFSGWMQPQRGKIAVCVRFQRERAKVDILAQVPNPVGLASEVEAPVRLSRLALGSDWDIEAEHDSGVGWAQSCFWLSARRQPGEAD
jgi:hypothetical protein